MAGISTREREDKARIADIKQKLNEPMPTYLYAKLQGTLNTLQRTQDRRVSERKAALEAKRPAAPTPRYNVLPDNHRGPSPEWIEKHRKPVPRPAVNAALLPRPGEAAAQIRARFEALAAAEG